MNLVRTIDLFCGAGGLSEGFRQAGFDVGLGLDVDEDALHTLRHNHKGLATVGGDVREASGRDLLDEAGFAEVDVLIGGPSCQGFSTHGRRTRWASEDDPRNLLYREFARLLDELQPEWFVMENVPGLLYYDSGAFGRQVVGELESKGYEVHQQILLAADYGIPQLRKRLIIVGTRTGYRFDWPEKTHMGAVRRDAIDLWEKRRLSSFPHLARHRTLWDAISDLPPLGSGGGIEKDRFVGPPESHYQRLLRGRTRNLYDHQAPELPVAHEDLIRHVKEGETWREIPRDLLPGRFSKIRRTDGTNLFARPDRNRPSYTITTQFGNVTTGAYTHPAENRAFSAREGARIQSFPDSFRFYGNLTSKYRQIGNAVPPMLAQLVATSVLKAMELKVPADNQEEAQPVEMQLTA